MSLVLRDLHSNFATKTVSMLELIKTAITAIGVVGGWEAIKYLLNRRTNQRMEETKADSLEFTLMKDTIEFLQQQLMDKEKRFADQTEIVRQQNTDILTVTREKAALELELQKYKCVVPKCTGRKPQNGY